MGCCQCCGEISQKTLSLKNGVLARAVASFCAACQENKKIAANRALLPIGLSVILVALKATVPSERVANCQNMTHNPHKSALACIGDSVSPWNSHEETDVEKTLAVCALCGRETPG